MQASPDCNKIPQAIGIQSHKANYKQSIGPRNVDQPRGLLSDLCSQSILGSHSLDSLAYLDSQCNTVSLYYTALQQSESKSRGFPDGLLLSQTAHSHGLQLNLDLQHKIGLSHFIIEICGNIAVTGGGSADSIFTSDEVNQNSQPTTSRHLRPTYDLGLNSQPTTGPPPQCDLSPLAIIGFSDSLFASKLQEQTVVTKPTQAYCYSGEVTSVGGSADSLLTPVANKNICSSVSTHNIKYHIEDLIEVTKPPTADYSVILSPPQGSTCIDRETPALTGATTSWAWLNVY